MVVYLFVVLGLVNDKEGELPCQSLVIDINDSTAIHFVTSKDIYAYVMARNKNLLGKSMNTIQTDRMEKQIRSIPFVKDANVYKTLEGSICVTLNQRQPIMHVLTYSGRNYYVDSEGLIMPENPLFTTRTLVVSGSFLEGAKTGHSLSGPELENYKTLKKAWMVANFIHSHPFWEAQIEQIWIEPTGEFILIPRVGAQTILFGSSDHLEDKFNKLYLLYKQGFAQEGWNTYNQINLKYSGQVVCTRR